MKFKQISLLLLIFATASCNEEGKPIESAETASEKPEAPTQEQLRKTEEVAREKMKNRPKIDGNF